MILSRAPTYTEAKSSLSASNCTVDTIKVRKVSLVFCPADKPTNQNTDTGENIPSSSSLTTDYKIELW